MKLIGFFLLTLLPLFLLAQSARDYQTAKNRLLAVQKNLRPQKQVTFSFHQTNRSFGHLSKPWQTNEYISQGNVLLNFSEKKFYLTDSLIDQGKLLKSNKYYSDTTLVIHDYGRNQPSQLTIVDHDNFIYEISRYTPLFLVEKLLNNINLSFSKFIIGVNDTLVFKYSDKIFKLSIDNKNLINSIFVLYPHEMYGDVLKKFTYKDYKNESFTYPGEVIESELGTETSNVKVTYSSKVIDITKVVQQMVPSGYRLLESKDLSQEVNHQKYNDNIHLLSFVHTDDRVLIVEFKDFLLVAEAPVNTENGELIIKKAKEILPKKPIKYFVFGHHHPHYLGGVRAFVHNETTILSVPQNESYVKQIAAFKHSLKPDILEKYFRPLKIELFEKSKVISDGQIEMQILHIGALSNHTEDYLVYYFPQYKLIFEDDLVWIKDGGPLKPASARQKGLYEAIIKNNLVVDIILQSWPVKNYGVKTVIDFKDLQKTVELLKP